MTMTEPSKTWDCSSGSIALCNHSPASSMGDSPNLGVKEVTTVMRAET